MGRVATGHIWPLLCWQRQPITTPMAIASRSAAFFAPRSGKVRDIDAATLEAQLLRIDQFELPVKGSAVFAANKLFSEFELSYFEAGLARFGEMGFPMEYKQIQAMMNTALRKADRKDILGRPLDVSIDATSGSSSGRGPS